MRRLDFCPECKMDWDMCEEFGCLGDGEGRHPMNRSFIPQLDPEIARAIEMNQRIFAADLERLRLSEEREKNAITRGN